MPTILILVPFLPGMEGAGFHSYEEAEEEHIPFVFPDSATLPPPEALQPDASENEDK